MVTESRNVTPSHPKPQACPDCGGVDFSPAVEQQDFRYGSGKDSVDLVAEFPVWRCSSCGIAVAGEDAEIAQTDAICEYLGILKPSEVAGIRKQYKQTQATFSQLTAIGEASLKRWEAGNRSQTIAHDNYLRLLRHPECFLRLQEIHQARTRKAHGSNVESLCAKFRSIDPAKLLERAKLFRLSG